MDVSVVLVPVGGSTPDRLKEGSNYPEVGAFARGARGGRRG